MSLLSSTRRIPIRRAPATVRPRSRDGVFAADDDAGPALVVRNLVITYRTHDGNVPAVANVSFTVRHGEVVALVGESGCGKSTLARAALGMLPDNAEVTSGSIVVAGNEVVGAPAARLRALRGGLAALIPQDPHTALNPLHRVGRQVVEPMHLQGLLPDGTHDATAAALLQRVGIDRPDDRARQYPGELSGGMKQRALIASAISTSPRLLVADEPTSALDVTVQRRILDDFEVITREAGMAVLLITHDLSVAADRADRIFVMREGKIVEEGPAATIISTPAHPYTQALLASHPGRRTAVTVSRTADRGERQPKAVLEADNVTVRFAGPHDSRRERTFTAVSQATLRLEPAETLGLIGESGSGKSTLARALLGLVKADAGQILFDGAPIDALPRDRWREFRRRVQFVYQNPSSSLDPRFTVRRLVAEPIIGFGVGRSRGRDDEVYRLLEEVMLPAGYADRRLHELSGGQRQRVAIARTLAARPEAIVFDEAVSALDVTLQAQILALLQDLQQRHRLAYLFISHDLGVVRHFADRTAVMRSGHIVEEGPTAALFAAPQHEYTRELIAAIPGGRVRTGATSTP